LRDEENMSDKGREKLDRAYKGLENETPDWATRTIRWLRDPSKRWIRLPVGLALIIGGMFGFLPILGFEFIPLGLLMIAQDVPFLREPVGNATIWLEEKWVELRQWWQRKRHE
jgi:membrane-bound ClpP family serine protease